MSFNDTLTPSIKMASTTSVPKAATVANDDYIRPTYTPGQHLQEFFKFAKCAPEVQDLIWGWACATNPSVVRVRINKDTVKYIGPLPGIPAVLHATSGSRGVALKHFQVVENQSFDRKVPRSVGMQINVFNQVFTGLQPHLNQTNLLTAQQFTALLAGPVPVAPTAPTAPTNGMLAANLPTTPPQLAPLSLNNYYSPATQGTGINVAAAATNAIMFQSQANTPINPMLPMNHQANLSALAHNAALGFSSNGLNHNNGAALGNLANQNNVIGLGINVPNNHNGVAPVNFPTQNLSVAAPANLANYNLNGLNLSSLSTFLNFPINQAQGLVNQARRIVNQAQGTVNQTQGAINQVRCRSSRRALADRPIQKFYLNPKCDIFMLEVGDNNVRYEFPEFRLSQDSFVLRPNRMAGHFEKQNAFIDLSLRWPGAQPQAFPTAGKLPVFFEQLHHVVFQLVLPPCLETHMTGSFKAWVKSNVDRFCDKLVSSTITKLPELESCDFLISGGGILMQGDRMMLKELREAPVTESNGLAFGAAELSVIYLALKDWFFCKHLDTMKDGSKLIEPRIVGWVPERVKRVNY